MANLVRLFEIAHDMLAEDLPTKFVVDGVNIALEYDGMSDFFLLWDEAEYPDDRYDLTIDIQVQIWTVRSSHLMVPITSVKKHVLSKFSTATSQSWHTQNKIFKAELFNLVKQYGSIEELSRESQIPIPLFEGYFEGWGSNISITNFTVLYLIKLGAKHDFLEISE